MYTCVMLKLACNAVRALRLCGWGWGAGGGRDVGCLAVLVTLPEDLVKWESGGGRGCNALWGDFINELGRVEPSYECEQMLIYLSIILYFNVVFRISPARDDWSLKLFREQRSQLFFGGVNYPGKIKLHQLCKGLTWCRHLGVPNVGSEWEQTQFSAFSFLYSNTH